MGIVIKMTSTAMMPALTPTPSDCKLPRIRARFATFNEGIDYAARSEKGLNFHDMRGQLERVYPYREMRDDALLMARRLIAAGIKPKDRVALIAETSADFAALFCACIYAGAWPVPLPLPTTFGGPVAKLRSRDAHLSRRNRRDGQRSGNAIGMRKR
jgi:fatty-acyl-CoA synthase